MPKVWQDVRPFLRDEIDEVSQMTIRTLSAKELQELNERISNRRLRKGFPKNPVEANEDHLANITFVPQYLDE